MIIRTTGTNSSGEDLLLVEFFVDIPSCQTMIALTTPADASIGFVKILVQEDESIAIKTLTGKTISLRIPQSLIPVITLKNLVHRIEGIPLNQQRLIYGGMMMMMNSI